jgi:hypothetical protein
LNFEPLAEFIVEEGGWLDLTLISDSPLLEHDAMFMLQQIEKSRHKQLEQKARDERRRALAAQQNITPEEMAAREAVQARMRTNPPEVEQESSDQKDLGSPPKAETNEPKVEAKADDGQDDLFASEDDDDLF